MKSKKILATLMALLSIAVAASAFWIVNSSSLTNTKPTAVVQSQPYIVQRPEEQPLATHRQLSVAATQSPTTLTPGGIAQDKLHGYMWVAEPGCLPTPKCAMAVQGALGQYAFSDGTFITDFNEPNGYSSPLFVAVDASGNVWFTQPTTDALGEFNSQTQTWNSYPVKKGSAPFDLTFDAEGNIWFTEFASNAIGFFNTQTHQVVETPTPTLASNPYGITVASDGTIWFTENNVGINQLGSFKPSASGAIKITEYPINGLRPHLITTDSVGNIWYSQGFAGTIGEFNPITGTDKNILVYAGGICKMPPNCTGTHISGIFVDSKNNIWFTDSLSQTVGYLVPATGQLMTRILPPNKHPYDGLIIDGSDRVWFTEQFGQALMMWPANTV